MFPWEENVPIVRVRKELYKSYHRHGVAASVTVDYAGPGLERVEVHSGQDRVDVPIETVTRVSADNGRTWSEFEPLPETLSYPAGVEVWEGSGPTFFDPVAGGMVDGWLRQIVEEVGPRSGPTEPFPGVPEGAWARQQRYCDGLRYNCFSYYRISRDCGKTWTQPRQFRYEDGAEFDPADPLKPSFLQRNQGYFGCNFLRHSNGALIYCLVHTNDHDDAENESRMWRLGSRCFIGQWDAGDGDYTWEAGDQVKVLSDISSTGLEEPVLAELADGRLLVVYRGSNTERTPGHKWFSISEDGGRTLSPVEELKYDDGSSFYSSSTIHRCFRHSMTGKLYWIGNITAVPPDGNWPRYPLVIAEVDEKIPAIRKSTVTRIDDRRPDQSAYVEFSNFSLLEDRETHDLEIYLTAFGESLDHINNANCYKYTLTLNDL